MSPTTTILAICLLVSQSTAPRESLAGGQSTSPAPVLLDVPTAKQPYNLCLVTSVSMVLRYWNLDISPEEIARHVPLYKDGTTGRDLSIFVNSLEFRGFLIQPELSDLFHHLEKRRPVIVTLPGRGSLRHAMVLVGGDAASIWLNDPASGRIRRLEKGKFLKEWEKTSRWAFLIVPKE